MAVSGETLFSIIIYAADTNRVYFRDCIESVVSQSYGNFELVIVDENKTTDLGRIVSEFFPEDLRIIYRHLNRPFGRARALNYAMETAHGDYYLFLGQHDRLSGNALALIVSETKKEAFSLLYTDSDELDASERVNPHFRSGFNVELLRQENYIGTSFVVKAADLVGIGPLRAELVYYPEWEFLLRHVERKKKVAHLPALLFHVRPDDDSLLDDSREAKKEKRKKEAEEGKKKAREAVTLVTAHLRKCGLSAEARPGPRTGTVKVDYDGSQYDVRREDYLFLRDRDILVLSRSPLTKLFGALNQPDVAAVGCRFLGGGLTVDNAGYIFDENGISYPACHGQSILTPGYGDRISFRQDVSAVDLGFCLINRRFYDRSGGFNGDLLGRDIMMDFFLKAKASGRRIIYDPSVTVYRTKKGPESSEASNAALLDRWKDRVRKGDPYYNSNLPMGVTNYTL